MPGTTELIGCVAEHNGMKKSKLLALREELNVACDRLARTIGSVDAVHEVMNRRYDHVTQRLDMLSQEIRELRRVIEDARFPGGRAVVYPQRRNTAAKSKR